MALDLRNWVDRVPEMSAEKLKTTLPSALDQIRQYGMWELTREVPALLARIMRRLVAIDAAKFANETPEVLDKFMDFFWEGASIIAAKNGKLWLMGGSIQANVNLEADDSPFTTHFGVSSGRLSGGSGLWRYKDQDFKYFGPTETLMRLLTGDVDLQQALFTKINFEGHPVWASRLGPVVALVIPSIVRGY